MGDWIPRSTRDKWAVLSIDERWDLGFVGAGMVSVIIGVCILLGWAGFFLSFGALLITTGSIGTRR